MIGKNVVLYVSVVYIVIFIVWRVFQRRLENPLILNDVINKYQVDIIVNGSRPQDIILNNAKFISILVKNPALTFGEGYMNKDWDTRDLYATLNAVLSSPLYRSSDNTTFLNKLVATLWNMQNISLSKRVAEQHYDVGNDLYFAMLDPYLQYSCAYWSPGVKTLEEAQEAKLKLICEKLELKPNMRVVDIGCGWGGLMAFMRKYYGVKPIGLTLSKEQIALGKKRFPENEFILMDYRVFCKKNENKGKYNRIVSVGMFEHVGYKNYDEFFACCSSILKPDGHMVLHTIGGKKSMKKGNDWLDKYIFPGGMLPSVKQIGNAIEGRFYLEDWQNFGPYYALTLQEWNKRSKRFFSETQNPKYNEAFRRMWEFYLVSCQIGFEKRDLQLWQLVLKPFQAETGVYHRKGCD